MTQDAPLAFAWPTSGRRPCLADSVAGFVANSREHGRVARYIIATDLGRGELAPALTCRLAGVERESGVELEYFDRAAREGLIGRLETEFDPELLRYALFPSSLGPGWGCNVNAAMLAAAGSLLVSCDDDVLCRPATLGGGPGGALLYSGEYSVSELRWFRDRPALLGAVSPVEVDVAGAYPLFLGKSRRELFGEFDAELGRGNAGPVLAASPGMYGDSAMGSLRSLLLCEGEDREALMADYEALRYSRELVRMTPATTISPSAQLVMTQTGLENRLALPPFLTYGRNPDGLFAVLARLAYPGSLTAYLDFGLYHDPPEPRSAGRLELVGFKPGLAELVMAYAAQAVREAGSAAPPKAEARFGLIGNALAELASLPPRDFAGELAGAWSRGLGPYAARLEFLLEAHGRAPSAWAADLEEHLGAVRRAMRDTGAAFGASGSGLGAGEAARQVGLYGRLLAAWPRLHGACARLAPSWRGGS